MHRREFLACMTAPLLAQSRPAASTAEQLGYDKETRLLMVHADDAGMCHSVNVATTEALFKNGVASASIMVPCPWFTEFAEMAKQHPELDLGLHLTLTSEWKYYRWGPVAPPDKVRGLIDSEGYLWRDVRSAATKASPAEVEIELRAQIERARQFGVKFTHFDTHMGTLYARPDYFEVYCKLSREAGVPCMMPRPTPDAAQEMKGYPITAAMLERKAAEGFVFLDRLVTGVPGRSVQERKESYGKFLRALKPGVTKLIVHLAKNDPEIQGITNNWEQRWADFLFFTSEESRRLMKELDIRAITYREMGKMAYKIAA